MQRNHIKSIKQIVQDKSCLGVDCSECYYHGKCKGLKYDDVVKMAKKLLREEKLNRICKENK